MKSLIKVLTIALTLTMLLTACAAATAAPVEEAAADTAAEAAADTAEEAPAADTAEEAPAEDQLVVYMQMGGQQGDASTLARTNGAKAAAEALNINLIEQYSGWDSQLMIDQFKEAIAASPDGIVIMGHPGEDAMGTLVDQAFDMGIVVISGNNPLPNIEQKYQTKGFGYAGADLYDGGYLTGQAMVAAGLKAGDR